MVTITFFYGRGKKAVVDCNARSINGAVAFAKDFLKLVMHTNSKASFYLEFDGERHSWWCRLFDGKLHIGKRTENLKGMITNIKIGW